MGIINAGIQSIAEERARTTCRIEKIHSEVTESVADELVEELTAEIGDGDVNGDGKVNSADVKKVQELIGSSVESVKATAFSACNVYRDNIIDVKDLMAVREIANGKKPKVPDDAASANTCILDITDAECCPGEQVKVDVNIFDWDQDIGAVELTMDFDSSLELADISCKGDYRYAECVFLRRKDPVLHRP